MPDYDQDELKQIMKEAVKEWMNEQFVALGKWTARAVAAAIFGALALFALSVNGWKHG